MTSEVGVHFLDAGPLLCLGRSHAAAGDFNLAEFYDAEFLANARVVEAVKKELSRQAAEPLQAGSPKMKGVRKKAAGSASHHYKQLLATAVLRPSPIPDRLERIEGALAALAERKKPGYRPHPHEHRGEAESIHWAAAHRAGLVACDGDAHSVAESHDVPSMTFVEVMRRVAKRRKDVDRNALFRALQNIAVSQIDIGERLNSPLDLA